MPALALPIVQRLRQPPRGSPAPPTPQAETGAAEERLPHEGAYLLCRACLHPIARPEDRMRVQGLHVHTFANPHGFVFEIGCFQNAPGCGTIGPASVEFTWFSGYRWRVCICAACLVHLGWEFLAAPAGGFYGLIIDRLIESSP